MVNTINKAHSEQLKRKNTTENGIILLKFYFNFLKVIFLFLFK